jgi:transposase-like protein
MIGGFVMAGKKGMKHYPGWMKYEAFRMYEEEGKSQAEIRALLGIQDRDRLDKWFKEVRNEREGNLKILKQRGRPHKTPVTKQREVELELKRLRMENELLKSFLLEAGRGD